MLWDSACPTLFLSRGTLLRAAWRGCFSGWNAPRATEQRPLPPSPASFPAGPCTLAAFLQPCCLPLTS